LVQTIRQEVNELVKKQVQLRSIGDISKLPSKSRKALKEGIEATAHNTGLKVVLALNYSAKWDMVQAAANLAREAASGKIDPESIDEHSFRSHLSTAQMPDVELMIRTSGEQRISNFLLWELAYAELFFSPKFWPEFRKQDFFEAILDFQGRERRFGKTGQQLKSMKIG